MIWNFPLTVNTKTLLNGIILVIIKWMFVDGCYVMIWSPLEY